MSRSCHIAVVDREPLFREGIIDAIKQNHVRIAGDIYGRDTLLKFIEQVRLDVLIIDEVGDHIIVNLLEAISNRFPTRVIAIADADADAECIGLAILQKTGISAILHRSSPPNEVRQALQRTLAGRLHVSDRLTKFRAVAPWIEVMQLDGIDLRIIRMLNRGATELEICHQIGFEIGKIKYRLSRMYNRLGVHNRLEVVHKLEQLTLA